MTFRPLLTLAILLILLVGVALLKRASMEGKVIIIFGALALAAFFRLHFYLLLLVALAFFAFIGTALVWAWIGLARLSASREVKAEAMVGERIPVRYRASSRSLLPLYHCRLWDRVYREKSDGSMEESDFEGPGYIGLLAIHRYEESEGMIHFMPQVRGVFRFGPVAIEGGDPFGIFTLAKWLARGGECLVLPGWVRLSGMPSSPARQGMREQEHLITKEGHSHEFLGIRPWTDGDSLRGVHWPLTAKHDALIVRQFQREVEEEILIVLDADAQADVGEGAENAFEYLITLSLSLAHGAYESVKPWTLVIVGQQTETISNTDKEALLRAQYALARIQAKRDKPIEPLLDEVRQAHRDSPCILLTPRTDLGPSDALARGDARSGEAGRSILVRVDPASFATSVEEGVKTLKRRRRIDEQPEHAGRVGATSVIEINIGRGDNLADLFVGRAFA